MVHCGSIRQTASILNMSKETLRTGKSIYVNDMYNIHGTEFFFEANIFTYKTSDTSFALDLGCYLHSLTKVKFYCS